MNTNEERLDDHDKRLTVVETELPHINRELKEIKKAVTNDLAHEMADIQTSVNTLLKRQNDLDAISRFLSVCLKGLGIVMGIAWTTRQVIKEWIK